MARKRRVGLLGGSFNPAHDGHRHISLLTLKFLRLDEIWWLVTPRNPLKSPLGLRPFEERLKGAQSCSRHRRIRVSDLEARLGTRYSAATLERLTARFPRINFVWIMGADNLAQISRWRDWTRIFALVPVAVFDRPTYAYPALAGIAARRYAFARVGPRGRSRFAVRPCPAWTFVRAKTHRASATAIRGSQGGQ